LLSFCLVVQAARAGVREMGIVGNRDGAEEALAVGARRTVHSIAPAFFDEGFLASIADSK
jgi:hypothetical protein